MLHVPARSLHEIGTELSAIVIFDEAQQSMMSNTPNAHTQMYANTVQQTMECTWRRGTRSHHAVYGIVGFAIDVKRRSLTGELLPRLTAAVAELRREKLRF